MSSQSSDYSESYKNNHSHPKSKSITDNVEANGQNLVPPKIRHRFPLFPTLSPVQDYDSNSCNQFNDPKNNYNVRSKDYIENAQKISSRDSLYELIGVDFIFTEESDAIIKSTAEEVLSFRKARRKGFKGFVLVMNFVMTFGNFIVYWTPKRTENNKELGESYLTGEKALDLLLEKLIKGDDEERNSRLKVIPCLIQGNWVLSKVITGKPAIICQKIPSDWFCDLSEGENYMEISINIHQNSVAEAILRLTKMYTNYVTIDLAFTLEGRCSEHLPEEILCAVRINKVHMQQGISLETLKTQNEPNGSKKETHNGFRKSNSFEIPSNVNLDSSNDICKSLNDLKINK